MRARDSDPTDELLTVTGLFTHFFSLDTTIAERQFMRRLATLIGTRAARLSACGIAAIVSKQGLLDEVSDPKAQTIGIATDGSLYNVRPSQRTSPVRQRQLTLSTFPRQKYPKFPQRLEEGLVDIFGEKGR